MTSSRWFRRLLRNLGLILPSGKTRLEELEEVRLFAISSPASELEYPMVRGGVEKSRHEAANRRKRQSERRKKYLEAHGG